MARQLVRGSCSKDGASFERAFELDQIDAWKARQNKGEHHLIDWQLDDNKGGNAQAYLLADQERLDAQPKPTCARQGAEIKELAGEDQGGWPGS